MQYYLVFPQPNTISFLLLLARNIPVTYNKEEQSFLS